MAPKKRRLNPPKHSEIEQAHPISQLSDHHSVENTKTVHLPNEIVSLIADEVHDLLPLTLVSRQWYHAAQSRLHWQICVFSGASCKQWSRKFKKFPHLGSFVRVLLLSDPEDDCLGSPYLRGQPAKNLAAALTGLTQLEITNFIRWGPVEQRLVKSFRNLEYLGIGRIPCMNRCKDVPDLVFSYPKLSGLMFYGGVGVGYDHHEAASIVEAGRSLGKQLPPDGKPVQIIDVLSLSNAEICHDQLMWLISPAFDLSKLRILAVRWSDLPAGMPSPPDFSALNALFARVSGTLSVLDLGFPDHEIQHRFPAMARIRDGPDFVSSHLIASRCLGCFTALTELRLDHFVKERNLPAALRITVPLLETLSAPCLRVIDFNAGGEFTSQNMYSSLPEWKRLDELLVNGTLRSLRSFRFLLHILHYCFERGLGSQLVRDASKTHWLPKANSKGILQLDITWEEIQSDYVGGSLSLTGTPELDTQ